MAARMDVDRRAAKRFRLQLPLSVRWIDGGVAGEALTVSRDISSRGVSFLLPRPISVGALVEVTLTLTHELTQAGPVWVRCLGRVVRSRQEADGAYRLSAAIDRYEFLRS